MTRAGFPKRENDVFDTPAEVARALLPFIDETLSWIEPCAGSGLLTAALRARGIGVVYQQDIAPRAKGVVPGDGADLPPAYDGIGVLTNPPFSRAVFRDLLSAWLRQGRDCWLLIPTSFLATRWFTKAGFTERIAEIVFLPRIRWIEGSDHSASKDHVWVRFDPHHAGKAQLHARREWE